MNKKIYITAFISVTAIIALLIGLMTIRERRRAGPPVSVPGAVYAKCFEIDMAPFRITIDKAGNLYLEEKQLSKDQLKKELRKLDPQDSWIKLRVDSDCTFGELEPILNILEDQKFEFTTFGVYEK